MGVLVFQTRKLAKQLVVHLQLLPVTGAKQTDPM